MTTLSNHARHSSSIMLSLQGLPRLPDYECRIRYVSQSVNNGPESSREVSSYIVLSSCLVSLSLLSLLLFLYSGLGATPSTSPLVQCRTQRNPKSGMLVQDQHVSSPSIVLGMRCSVGSSLGSQVLVFHLRFYLLPEGQRKKSWEERQGGDVFISVDNGAPRHDFGDYDFGLRQETDNRTFQVTLYIDSATG